MAPDEIANAIAKLEQMMDQHIERVGWGVQGVFNNEGAGAFAYTVGLNLKHGIELLINGKVSLQVLQLTLNETAQRMVDGKPWLEGYESEAFEIDVGGERQGARVGIVEVSYDRAREAEYFAFKRGVPQKVYQVLLCDRQNKLPYDTGFNDIYGQVMLNARLH